MVRDPTALPLVALFSLTPLVAGPATSAAGQEIPERFRVQIRGTVRDVGAPGQRESVQTRGVLHLTRNSSGVVIELEGFEDLIPVTRLQGSLRGTRLVARTAVKGSEDDVVALQGGLRRGQLRATLVRSGPGGAEASGGQLVQLSLLGRPVEVADVREERPDPEEAEPEKAEVGPVDTLRVVPQVQVQLEEPAEELPVEFRLVQFEPPYPTVEQRVRFLVRVDPRPGHQVDRVIVRVGNTELATSPGDNTLDRTAGPFERGRHQVEILAKGPEGRVSRTQMRTLRVRAGGDGVVQGRVTGRTDLVQEVLLQDDQERPVARTELDADGRYRFSDLPADRFWVAIPTGRQGNVRVEPERIVLVEVDGESTYTRDFEVIVPRFR